MSWHVMLGPLEQGLIYGLMALGVYITFRVLDFPDLTIDGSFPMGAAVAATLIAGGNSPVLATCTAPILGAAAGLVTGILNTKLKISGLLSGILTMTALYSINLRIMGGANVPLLRKTTIITQLESIGIPQRYVPLFLFVIVVGAVKIVLDIFLHTSFGLALRATGDNEKMIRSLGVDTDTMKVFGLALSNAIIALTGAFVAQYQGFADIGMGIGMIIVGLASVILGSVIIRPYTVGRATLAAIVGAIVYRFVVFLALRMGLAPTDLKIVTAVIVIVALSGKQLRWLVFTGRSLWRHKAASPGDK